VPGPKVLRPARGSAWNIGNVPANAATRRPTESEASGKYDHAEQGFVSVGCVYTLEESSDVARFTDTQVSRFFVNVLHPVTSRIFVSGSATYELSNCKVVEASAILMKTSSASEEHCRMWQRRIWTAAVTYDYDHVDSDDAARLQTRHRLGLTGTFAF